MQLCHSLHHGQAEAGTDAVAGAIEAIEGTRTLFGGHAVAIVAHTPDHSVGRCLLYLAGGDMASGDMPEIVPDRLQRFIKYLTRVSAMQRAQDAWEMFRELERVRAAVYGAHRFVEFVVPS